MITTPTIEIDILTHSQHWDDLGEDITALTEKICAQTLQKCLKERNLQPAHIEISLLLTGDAEIQDLNREYREKDKPTNVLSFPQIDWDAPIKGMPIISLGDIVVSFDTIHKEAEEQSKSFNNHFTHMLVHGVLHLLGYDHIHDTEAEIMETLEISLLADMGVKNPYAAGEFMRQ